MTRKISTAYHDYYYLYLPVIDVRVGYIFKLVSKEGKTVFLSENRIFEDKFDFHKAHYEYFQIAYINENDIVKVNPKFQDRTFYQIFVDRFFIGGEPTNKKINVKWGENEHIDRMTFAGGNLKGITAKLDYLKELGINALYLTPIFEAYSNHKYETYDYFKIAEDFGDETTFQELVEEAHKRDILIVLDGVFNHIAFYSPLFQDVVKNGKESPYFSWFILHNQAEKVDLEHVNYESFGFGKFMPKLNMNNKAAQEYIISVCKHYVEKYHVDGYRLDVADEVAHDFWKALRRELLKVDPNLFLIAEDWHDSYAFLHDQSEFDSVMNYPFTSALLDLLALSDINENQFVDRLNLLKVKYKDATNHNVLNLIDSHDKARFINESGFNENRTRIAFSLLYLYPGIPMLYYGDEIGLTGFYDPDCRKMFTWDENTWNKERFSFIKNLIFLHKQYNLNHYEFTLSFHDDLLFYTLHPRDEEENILLTEVINLRKDKDIAKIIQNKTILLSNNMEKHCLKQDGFVIFR